MIQAPADAMTLAKVIPWVIAGLLTAGAMIALAAPTVWRVTKKIESVAEQVVPPKTASGELARERLFEQIGAIQENVKQLRRTDGEMQRDIGALKLDVHRLSGRVESVENNQFMQTTIVNQRLDKHSSRLTNVEERCNMTHRRADSSDEAVDPLEDKGVKG